MIKKEYTFAYKRVQVSKRSGTITLRPGKKHPNLIMDLENLADDDDRKLNPYCIRVLASHAEQKLKSLKTIKPPLKKGGN